MLTLSETRTLKKVSVILFEKVKHKYKENQL